MPSGWTRQLLFVILIKRYRQPILSLSLAVNYQFNIVEIDGNSSGPDCVSPMLKWNMKLEVGGFKNRERID